MNTTLERWLVVSLVVLFTLFWGLLCFGCGVATGLIFKKPTVMIQSYVAEDAGPFIPGMEYDAGDLQSKSSKSKGSKSNGKR